MNEIEYLLNNKENYVAYGIDTFQVDNETYSGVTTCKSFWEKTFVKSPDRTNNGAMGDINNLISTFVTFHYIATFDLMPIADFRRLMKQFNGNEAGIDDKTEFDVMCYDHIYDRVIIKKMYLITPQMPEYWTETLDDGRVAVLGVRNFTVEFVGTNND